MKPPSAELITACHHRGGTNCFADGGFIITPPADHDTGYARFKVPPGSLYFLATLTEYSGSSCNGGSAVSQVLVDGNVVKQYDQGQNTNQSVRVDLPRGTRFLELQTVKGGSAWCDDPAWMNARFSNKP